MKNILLITLSILCFTGLLTAQHQFMTGTGEMYTDDFTSYAGTAAPTNWTVNGTFTFKGQGNGSSNVGGYYSYGVNGDTDRSLGMLRSGSAGDPHVEITFTNMAPGIIQGISIEYNCEQWRAANTSGITVTGTGLSGASLSALDHTGVSFGIPPFTTAKSANIGGLNIGKGSNFTIKFTANNVTGSDNGFGIDDFKVTITQFLPVELIRFDVASEDNSNVINWATASERNNKYFAVENSTDGVRFNEIDIINGAGNSTDVINYSYTHKQPAKGVNYYRLRQVDFDGTETYSKVVVVAPANQDVFTAFPTMVSDELTISAINDVEEDTQVSIISMSGQVMSQQVMAQDNNRLSLDVANLPSGQYIAQMKTGNSVQNIRFVK